MYVDRQRGENESADIIELNMKTSTKIEHKEAIGPKYQRLFASE